jgi:hypothetical protein
VNYLDLRATMRSGVPVAIVLLTLALTATAQGAKASPTARQLTTLLNEFLDAAGRGDRAVFDRRRHLYALGGRDRRQSRDHEER